jgi:hypothetical protein
MDKNTGKLLNYRQLMNSPKYKKAWSLSAANKFGRLANSIGGRIKNPTNTIEFISQHKVPADRKKDITYGQFVCLVRPKKAEPNQMRFTVGGNRINHPGEIATPTTEMLVAKMLFNSVISMKDAQFMTMNISNFYLMTPLHRAKFIQIKLSDIPNEVIREYKLREKATKNGSIYITTSQERTQRTLQTTCNWTGKRYIGVLDWNYHKCHIHLSLPNYMQKASKQFQHKAGKLQHAPYQNTPIQYDGAKKQYATQELQTPLLDDKAKRFIQQICGKFLFLGRAVDSTLLCSISTIALQSSKPTEDTMRQTLQLFDYLATQEDAVLSYHTSNMVLAVHRDASYLSKPKARSQVGGHFFLSSDTAVPPNNGAILNIAHIIKNVMSSATEAELAGLYIMARKAIYRIILEDLGHIQPPTPLQTDNAMADGIINGKVQPKQTRAMDMRFHWIRDQECQRQFLLVTR